MLDETEVMQECDAMLQIHRCVNQTRLIDQLMNLEFKEEFIWEKVLNITDPNYKYAPQHGVTHWQDLSDGRTRIRIEEIDPATGKPDGSILLEDSVKLKYHDLSEIEELLKTRGLSFKTLINFVAEDEPILNSDPPLVEIFEWHCVTSSWLEKRLLEKEEPFLMNDYGNWWGRKTTGQSIKIDEVMFEIVREHEERVPGFSWKKLIV